MPGPPQVVEQATMGMPKGRQRIIISLATLLPR